MLPSRSPPALQLDVSNVESWCASNPSACCSAEFLGVEMPVSPDAPRKIREKLAAGRLPRDAPPMTATGQGTGNLCDGCDTPIDRDQMQYEFEAPGRRFIRLHVWCGLLWEAYRREANQP